MATARDIIDAALSELGVRAAGETIAAADASEGLLALNRMLDAWAAERLMIYTVTRTTWTITANDGQYTVGTSANVNRPRPAYVERVSILDTSSDPDTESPLAKLTEDGWAGISMKAQTSDTPQAWYYNPTYPTGTLDLWPVPTSSTLQGVMYAPQAVSQFTDLTTAVSVPNGYERALVKNLAVELGPPYGRKLDAALAIQAQESKAVIKRANNRLSDLMLDPAALIGTKESYDIYQG
ncbi:MAG: hypothetical protein VW405_20355 [Rhodospirillaceae bacterium]